MNCFDNRPYSLQNENGVNVFVTLDHIYIFNNADAIGNVKPGSYICVGDQYYIVLGHGADTTALLAYSGSCVLPTKRETCDDAILNPVNYLLNTVNNSVAGVQFTRINIPREYIVPHTVKFSAENGDRPRQYQKRPVSLLTANLYRRYRQHLVDIDHDMWLVTPTSGFSFNTDDWDYFTEDEIVNENELCFVRADGRIGWAPLPKASKWIHPFLIVDSQYRQYEPYHVRR